MPVEPHEPTSALEVVPTEQGLELRFCGAKPGQGVCAELAPNRSGRHPLSKALRGCPGPIVDATAGLGGDTAVMAGLGRHVLSIERDPTLFAMLTDAHNRLEDRSLAEQITLWQGDAVTCLADLPAPFDAPAAIVLDPMYPPRRKASALPSKSMQLLRALVGGAASEGALASLLNAAFTSRARRVILKRPPEAERPDGIAAPTFSIGSKLVRWDVWDRG